MTWKRRKMHESQRREYIHSGNITQTQVYKRPKLTLPQQKELLHTGTVTLTYKTTVTLNKSQHTEKKTRKILNAHDKLQKEVRDFEEQELTIRERSLTHTYIRWGFVIVYSDGTSSPNNEQGYRIYPGHPSYKQIIAENIPWAVLKTSDMWQGGFQIKTWINIKGPDNEYRVLDQMEYTQ